MSTSKQIRKRALRGVAISVAVAAVFLIFVLFLVSKGWELYGPGVGVPLVPLLYFLTELITGRSFVDLARRWDELDGLQRFFLGLFVVFLSVIAFAVIALIVVLIAK